MIEFATLLLYLVTGFQDVHLMVGAGVARASVLLDGAVAAEVTGPPWGVAVDFGDDLAPHELTAIAYDEIGREIGRAVQRINRMRTPARVSAVVNEEDSRWVARVEWLSLTAEEPRRVRMALDGKPVVVSDPRRTVLPDVGGDRLHVLRVELSFEGGLEASTDVVFGRGPGDEASARLTAVPVRSSSGKAPPAPDRMTGWFTARGAPVKVVAVEEPAADIVFVVDRRGRETLGVLSRARVGPSQTGVSASRVAARKIAPLDDGQFVSVVGTRPSRRDRDGKLAFDLFPRSLDRPPYYGGLLWILDHSVPSGSDAGEERVADAVALAGLAAAERDRRRAVVLFTVGSPGEDASDYSPEEVKRYLDGLGVPLQVWCTEGTTAEGWGACTTISSTRRLEQAARRLSDEVKRQRIVWVEGTHELRAISLAPAKGLEMLSAP